MCHESCLIFVAQRLPPSEIAGREVIELGALGAAVRPLVEHWGPARYLGVDIATGPGVDVVCRVEEAARRFGDASFDLVLSTEMLEHVRDWRAAVENLKRLCRPGGRIVVTTRSVGFPYHGAPNDFWRFDVADMRRIFSDFTIEAVESDPQKPGVFLSATKPDHYSAAELAPIALYAMPLRRRALAIRDEDLRGLRYARVRADYELRRAVSLVVGLYLDRMGRK